MAGVYRQPLVSLQENTQNALVIGIIIHSLNPRTFELDSPYRSGSRGVWTFTLRDSEHDTINVTAWGSVEYISKLFTTFQIADVVDVINPKVTIREIGGKNDLFVPSVSSPYSLTVNEGVAIIQGHEYFDKGDFKAYLQRPIRNIESLRPLSSIMGNLQAMLNQFVDMIGECRIIRTKDGRTLETRDFEATDCSFTQSTVAFKLWETSWARRSGTWMPRNTVILLTDVQILYDKFRKKIAPTIVRKTLITENPDVPQANEVRKSILSGSEYMPQDPFVIPKPDTIRNVMTIMDITEKLNTRPTGYNDRVQFLALLYAQITEIILDDANLVITRCVLCKRIVPNGGDSCRNLECPCGNGRKVPENMKVLYLRINLKDETGYLIGCRLTGVPAENALGCSAEELEAMTLEARRALRNKFCSELFDVKLQVLGPSSTFPRALYNVLSLNRYHEKGSEDETAGTGTSKSETVYPRT